MEIKTLSELQEPDGRSLMWSVWTAAPEKATELAQYALSQIALSLNVPETTRQSSNVCALCSPTAFCVTTCTPFTGDLARLVTEQALRERFLPFYGGTVNFIDGQGRPQTVAPASYDDLYRALRLRGWAAARGNGLA